MALAYRRSARAEEDVGARDPTPERRLGRLGPVRFSVRVWQVRARDARVTHDAHAEVERGVAKPVKHYESRGPVRVDDAAPLLRARAVRAPARARLELVARTEHRDDGLLDDAHRAAARVPELAAARGHVAPGARMFSPAGTDVSIVLVSSSPSGSVPASAVPSTISTASVTAGSVRPVAMP
jgi:hypothetical protein